MTARRPLTLATLGKSPRGHDPRIPYSPHYDDLYHSDAGAWSQSRHVFLAGNDLPARWQGRTRFVILETGFGLGNNFLATWQAWRQDPQRCEQLVFISIEKHPLSAQQLRDVHARSAHAPDEPMPDWEVARTELAARLVAQWPVLTPGWHTIDFEVAERTPGGAAGQVRLMLGLGDVHDLIPSLMAQVDSFYLDGFSPAKNPDMWDARWLGRLDRLAAPGAMAATWSVARPMRDTLTKAGFVIERRQGHGSKRDMVSARFEPRHVAAPPAGGLWAEPDAAHRTVAVVGAGLAGCAAAWALTRQGWQVHLIDAQAEPATLASGNPGGMFHAILHGEDGVHARAYRAAALRTAQVAGAWMAQGLVPGQATGLMRLDELPDGEAQALLQSLGLPDSFVHWQPVAQAAHTVGCHTPSGGWQFDQGGWLSPPHYARAFLQSAQTTGRLHWHPGRRVSGLHRAESGWALRSEGQAEPWLQGMGSVVLANAHALGALVATLPSDQAGFALPGGKVRGQITHLPPDACVARLHQPVAGQGYALSLPDGSLLCGATSQHQDDDPSVRDADHRHNLQQAARLGAWQGDAQHAALDGLSGRTQWRATTPDRLPLVGALPWSWERLQALPARARLDQPRMVPRERNAHGGLFVLGGLGSRGITWAALAGDLLAHWVTGSPCPVEADLRDALDPARWVVRQVKQGRHTAAGT
ncbi:FAD-dependent oxidoreductase [Aquabacterium lacunae]|uniref:tRNA 5-methylaminomethyl-2-thiouridine biosynthesis bifunctional protein MnmC n=1 Tax=Aquabacterium lacunae TaxID=2528630 RepID=A0A4V2JFE3_9BURK|nr:FAD-dependent 5-carboxymethylaminomethyl-2-thiouridine(34) oxidoreductase MnmC [Aquabacterium lacunae]TBO28774.1 FAD-dependent oxidoreductase [Aquabacterium lacunae]